MTAQHFEDKVIFFKEQSHIHPSPNLEKKCVQFLDAALFQEKLAKIYFVVKPFKKVSTGDCEILSSLFR